VAGQAADQAAGKIGESTPVAKKIPSSDLKAPVPLALGEVVGSRLDDSEKTSKYHYWLVDLPAGRYKFVLDVRNAAGNWSLFPTVGGRLHWCYQDGREPMLCGEVEDEGPRCRKVLHLAPEVPVKAVLRYENRFTVSDYELGLFAEPDTVGRPFFAQCPKVQFFKQGQPMTTPAIGNQQATRDAYCFTRLPGGDYLITVEFRDIEGIPRGGVGGSVDLLDADGEVERQLLGDAVFDNSTLKRTILLPLGDERTLLLRIRANCNGDTREVVRVSVEKRE
jgi:hypothetical protein